MTSLLVSYSLGEIITFIIVFALAAKGVIDFLDWAKTKIKTIYTKEKTADEEKKTTSERLDSLEESVEKVTDSINKIDDKVDLLIKSDKDDIKAFITREHHYFCYQKGWIDDYSLDCLEKRFNCYLKEGGNSFAKDLMDEVRALPKKPPQTTT